jgi:hypothetical protein
MASRISVPTGIEHPMYTSFEIQKLETLRQLELMKQMVSDGRAEASKYIKEKEDKIKVLDNLITLYGPDPSPEYNKSLGIFIADVYGDRHTSGCPSEMKISDCYKKALYPYCGSYIAKEWNTHIRYYKPDGTGKYVFYKIEKKL